MFVVVVLVVLVVVVKICNCLAFTVVSELDGGFGAFISVKHNPTDGIDAVRGNRMAPWLYNGLFLRRTVDVEH